MVYTNAAKEYLDAIVGSENVMTDISELLRYGNPDCIVKVATIDQIQQILEVANEQDIGIIPKSSKINFTDGTKTEEGGIILLSLKLFQSKLFSRPVLDL